MPVSQQTQETNALMTLPLQCWLSTGCTRMLFPQGQHRSEDAAEICLILCARQLMPLFFEGTEIATCRALYAGLLHHRHAGKCTRTQGPDLEEEAEMFKMDRKWHEDPYMRRIVEMNCNHVKTKLEHPCTQNYQTGPSVGVKQARNFRNSFEVAIGSVLP